MATTLLSRGGLFFRNPNVISSAPIFFSRGPLGAIMAPTRRTFATKAAGETDEEDKDKDKKKDKSDHDDNDNYEKYGANKLMEQFFEHDPESGKSPVGQSLSPPSFSPP